MPFARATSHPTGSLCRLPLRIFLSSAVLTAGVSFAATAPAADFSPPKPSEAKPSDAVTDPNVLRICASGNQLPYSSADKSGFENKVAEIVAKAMGRKPVFVFADKPAIYLVRDWLDKKKCDVVIGLDTGDQRVLTTKPYYRASYVFISKKDSKSGIESWNDPQVKKLKHIVVDFGSPSEEMLKELGLYNDEMAYLYSLVGFRAPRNQYVQISPEKMLGEVRSGEAELAAGFAPDVARYVKADQSLAMVPIKDDATHNGGDRLPQQYDQSMGVRLGDTALVSELDKAITQAKPEINAVLSEEGIPVIEASKGSVQVR